MTLQVITTCTCESVDVPGFPHRPWCATEHQHPGPLCPGLCEPPEPSPCQCHQSHAAISPTHGGHCCFVPDNQTCHPDEVAAWTEGRQ